MKQLPARAGPCIPVLRTDSRARCEPNDVWSGAAKFPGFHRAARATRRHRGYGRCAAMAARRPGAGRHAAVEREAGKYYKLDTLYLQRRPIVLRLTVRGHAAAARTDSRQKCNRECLGSIVGGRRALWRLHGPRVRGSWWTHLPQLACGRCPSRCFEHGNYVAASKSSWLASLEHLLCRLSCLNARPATHCCIPVYHGQTTANVVFDWAMHQNGRHCVDVDDDDDDDDTGDSRGARAPCTQTSDEILCSTKTYFWTNWPTPQVVHMQNPRSTEERFCRWPGVLPMDPAGSFARPSL